MERKTKLILTLLIISIYFVSLKLNAQNVIVKGDYIYSKYKYTLGDNDSKNEAKKICFLEAKRLCLEKAGTYIESHSEIRNYQLAKDEIVTYAGAFIEVEIISEEMKFSDENIYLEMTVKAKIDVKSFKDKILHIKNNKDLASKIRYQQKQITELKEKIRSFHNELKNKSVEKAIQIKRQRNIIFNKLDELQKIKYEISTKTQLATDKIEIGMIPNEVISLIGEPRSKDECSNHVYYNYGKVWVIFESGVVSCLIRAEYFYKCAGRSYYNYKPKAIIK